MPVIGVRKFRPERLIQSADDYQQGLWLVRGTVVKAAEQPVVVTAGAIDADLEPSRHIALHRFPVPAACESLRRRGSDLRQDRTHSCSYLNRAGIEELPAQYCLFRIVVAVPPKEHHLVRIIRGRPGANLRRSTLTC